MAYQGDGSPPKFFRLVRLFLSPSLFPSFFLDTRVLWSDYFVPGIANGDEEMSKTQPPQPSWGAMRLPPKPPATLCLDHRGGSENSDPKAKPACEGHNLTSIWNAVSLMKLLMEKTVVNSLKTERWQVIKANYGNMRKLKTPWHY